MEGSQPAQKNGRSIKKNMNSSTSVMYISVCPVSYVAVVLFTCTLVRSHPDSRSCWGLKLNCCHKQLYTGLGVTTRCMLVRRGQRWAQYMPEARP
jgi:hypothetical protein